MKAASAFAVSNVTATRPPTSALLSAFFSKFSRNTADFFGHRAWPLVEFSFLACGARGTAFVSGEAYWGPRTAEAIGAQRGMETALAYEQIQYSP